MDDDTLDEITRAGWNLVSIYRGGVRTWWRQEGENYVFRITHPDTPDIFWTLTPDETASMGLRVVYAPEPFDGEVAH